MGYACVADADLVRRNSEDEVFQTVEKQEAGKQRTSVSEVGVLQGHLLLPPGLDSSTIITLRPFLRKHPLINQ